MVAKILESGILTFINILEKLCIYPYIVNHVIWTALFGIQKSLESSQESWNQARNLGILPRFRITSKKIQCRAPRFSATANLPAEAINQRGSVSHKSNHTSTQYYCYTLQPKH